VYHEAPAPERLSGAVSCLWWSDDGPKRIVPDGCLDLIVGDGKVFVAGPDTHAWESSPAMSALHGIRFRPGHAPRVLGIAADELCDQRVELPDLWGRHGVVAAERLLTDPAKLTEVVGENLRELSDPAVAELLARLEVGVSRVSSAIRDLAVSERQLRRRFTVAVGYGPATYLRVARLQRAITRASSAGTLASLAAEAGYADQAHLSRDCRELTGTTPGEFFRKTPVTAAGPARSGKPAPQPARDREDRAC
jgi:AraC-like DNA-binding protein